MRTTRHGRRRATVGGVTLIELMIGLVVMGVLAAIAVPSMYEFIMRKRVEGVADELLTNLRLLRTANILNTNGWTHVDFRSNATLTCYAIYTEVGGLCDCRNPPSCNNPDTEAHKIVQIPLDTRIRIDLMTGSASRLTLHRLTGLPTSARPVGVEVWAPQGGRVRVSLNPAGQPIICSVAGHSTAYPAC